jgi:enediyne biosynthesis protein E5
MKIGKYNIGRVYLILIALLCVLAAVAAYSTRTFPLSIFVAVAACILIEVALAKLSGKRLKMPISAIITGIIIGSVAPITVPFAVVVLAALLAESTKFFIKIKSRNVFNPAAIGLLVALILFGIGDEWWASPTMHFHGFLIPLSGILIISAWQSRRLFVGISAAVVAAIGIAAASGFLEIGLLTSVLAVNYYFVFLMVSDPKTSPNNMLGQIIYGAGVSASAMILVATHIQYALLIALLLANVCYAAFRFLYKPAASKYEAHAAVPNLQPT